MRRLVCTVIVVLSVIAMAGCGGSNSMTATPSAGDNTIDPAVAETKVLYSIVNSEETNQQDGFRYSDGYLYITINGMGYCMYIGSEENTKKAKEIFGEKFDSAPPPPPPFFGTKEIVPCTEEYGITMALHKEADGYTCKVGTIVYPTINKNVTCYSCTFVSPAGWTYELKTTSSSESKLKWTMTAGKWTLSTSDHDWLDGNQREIPPITINVVP